MDTPLPSGQNVPSPIPASPSPAPPAVVPAASGVVKTAGFFTTKIIAAIIGVAVVGGGIGVGYFVFPEPFYNTVGKYIGLPAPSGVSGPAAQEQERATAEEKTETPSSAGETSALFDTLGQKIIDSLHGIQKPMSEPLGLPPDLPLLNQPAKEFLVPTDRVPEEESANDGKVLRKRN